MPKENDLEGQQDQGGKHGGQKGQKGMPKPEPRPGHMPPQKVRRKDDGDKPEKSE
jgi:hypothetical protein